MSDSAPPNLTPGDLSFVFVIEGARLQTQSLILADSLRRHHPNADIIAYLPGDGELDPLVRGFLALCDVQLRPVKGQEKQWKQPYPHGNKILSLAEPRDTRWSMFLDTDMAALAPIDPGDLPGPMQVSVVPEGIASWGKDLAKWQTAYDYFDLPMPTERIRLLRGRRLEFPPYFNAGMVAICEADRIEGRNFGGMWRATAREFDWRAKVSNKRPWLDQITLPLAMKRFGFTAKIVDERNNCSISNDRKFDGLAPALLHYHRAGFLRKWPGHEALFEAVLQRVAPETRAEIEHRLTQGGYLGEEKE